MTDSQLELIEKIRNDFKVIQDQEEYDREKETDRPKFRNRITVTHKSGVSLVFNDHLAPIANDRIEVMMLQIHANLDKSKPIASGHAKVDVNKSKPIEETAPAEAAMAGE